MRPHAGTTDTTGRPATAAAIGLAILAAAAVARFGFLGHQTACGSTRVDSVRLASGHTAAELWTGNLDPVHPPLFYVVLRGALSTFGAGEWAARLPSALASLLSVALVFVLARNLGLSLRAATTAAILLALAPLDIWYAREARMYVLVAMAALVFAIGVTWDSWSSWRAARGGRADRAVFPGLHDRPASGRADRASAWRAGGGLGRPRPALIRLALAGTGGTLVVAHPLAPDARRGRQPPHVTFFKRVGEMTGAGWPGGGAAAVLLLLVTIVIGTAAVILVRWLGDDLFRRRLSWIVWIGFAAATAALALPRAYSAKQILVTGWPFVVIAAAWSLTDAGEPRRRRLDGRRCDPPADHDRHLARRCALHADDPSGRLARGRRADRQRARGVRVTTSSSCPCGTRSQDHYYRPILAASPNSPPAAPWLTRASGDVWLIAERFGPRPPSSPEEAWLDGHLTLVESVPFSRLEVRRYRPGAR